MRSISCCLLLAAACGPLLPTEPAAMPETWEGTATGSSGTTDFFCTDGVISHSASFTLSVPRSLTAALAIPYDADARIRSASGTWTDEAKGAPDCQGGPYTIVTENVTGTRLVVDASPVVERTGEPPIPEINVRSFDASTIVPFHLRQTMTGDDVDVGSEAIVFEATNVMATVITGTWRNVGGGSASGNGAKGTFTLRKK